MRRVSRGSLAVLAVVAAVALQGCIQPAGLDEPRNGERLQNSGDSPPPLGGSIGVPEVLEQRTFPVTVPGNASAEDLIRGGKT